MSLWAMEQGQGGRWFVLHFYMSFTGFSNTAPYGFALASQSSIVRSTRSHDKVPPPPRCAFWVPCCVLGNCVLSPVPSWASRAQAVSGQGRSLDLETCCGVKTLAIWERLLHQGDHFPLQKVREEVSIAEPLTRTLCLQPPSVCSSGNTSGSHLCGGVPGYKDKAAPNLAHCGV